MCCTAQRFASRSWILSISSLTNLLICLRRDKICASHSVITNLTFDSYSMFRARYRLPLIHGPAVLPLRILPSLRTTLRPLQIGHTNGSSSHISLALNPSAETILEPTKLATFSGELIAWACAEKWVGLRRIMRSTTTAQCSALRTRLSPTKVKLQCMDWFLMENIPE
ncbi:hypothetical protein DL93DRAFT_579697 [Clavulina sp. PMI_390]|nr:hypothetical protein DL93DRAFT_579697 [Clavulina sp. PMI_390]